MFHEILESQIELQTVIYFSLIRRKRFYIFLNSKDFPNKVNLTMKGFMIFSKIQDFMLKMDNKYREFLL